MPKFAHVDLDYLLPNSVNKHVPIAINVIVEPNDPIDVHVRKEPSPVVTEDDARLEDARMLEELPILSV